MSINTIPPRILSTCGINEETIKKLKSKGFNHKTEIMTIRNAELKYMCDLTDDEMKKVDEEVKKSHKSKVAFDSAFHLFAYFGFITTGTIALDAMFDSKGIRTGRLTQICGEGGTGKTQIAMQLCINVQLPEKSGGVPGNALYVDTENNIRPERLRSMTEFCLNKFRELNANTTVDQILSNIHLKTCIKDSQQLRDLIDHEIEPFIDKNMAIRLLVIDSITQHFRYDYKGKDRDYELMQIGHKLKYLADKYNLAIVITNQVAYSQTENKVIPCLGRSWQSMVSTSIMIERNGINANPRTARHLKSSQRLQLMAYKFDVTKNGIQDISHVEETFHRNNSCKVLKR